MPYSNPENIEWVTWALELKQPKTILDIGPGAGKYGKLAKETLPNVETTCVEIWAPYVSKFSLHDIYDVVHISDARIYQPQFVYDMTILGDVLEHMSRAEAVALWKKTMRYSRSAIISIPIIHYPQGDFDGNPFEVHVEDHWTHEEVLNYFPGITGYRTFDTVGVYIAEFER